MTILFQSYFEIKACFKWPHFISFHFICDKFEYWIWNGIQILNPHMAKTFPIIFINMENFILENTCSN